MAIPEDKEKLEAEKEMWTSQWDMRLVRGDAIRIDDGLTCIQATLQVSLQKARDHGMEQRVAGHVVAKMDEVHPMCARWKDGTI